MALLPSGIDRFIRFALIGGGVFTIGLALQWTFVAAGLPVTTAYTIQLMLTILLNYELNRRLTWADRAHSRTVALHFLASRLVTAGASFVVFVSLMLLPGMHHLAANALSVVLATVANFVIGERLVFRLPTTAIRTNRQERSMQFKHAIKWLVVAAVLGSALLLITTPRIGLPIALCLLTVYAVVSTGLGMLNNHLFDYTSRTQADKDAIAFPEPRDGVADHRLTSFSLILPAYGEEDVIARTLEQLARQDYPADKFEILVTLRADDTATVSEAERVAARYPGLIKVFALHYGAKSNKSTQMNAVLPHATGEYVCPIDAEDVVAARLLRHMDARIHLDGPDAQPDVSQGGVQLTNLDNRTTGSWLVRMRHFLGGGWFAVHNVMEYRTWFSSRMFFQQNLGFVPLGGNTVFIRTALMRELDGWDDQKLTEDAHLGTLLSVRGAKIVASYSPELATQEHTPPRMFGSGSMFKQRVRWDQGFWQVLRDGQWRKLPTIKQRLMALYLLGTPVLQAFSGVMLPFALASTFFMKAPLLLTMLLFMPFIPMIRTMVMQLIELRALCKDFGLSAKPRHYLSLVIGFFPYQFLLGMAAVVAVCREAAGIQTWSKTARNPGLHGHAELPTYSLHEEGVTV